MLMFCVVFIIVNVYLAKLYNKIKKKNSYLFTQETNKPSKPPSHRPPLRRSTALPSNTGDNSEARRLKGPKGSGSDTKLYRESHSGDLSRGFVSTESLNDDDLRQRTWNPAILRKAVSIDGLNRSGCACPGEDWGSKKTSTSIAVS